LVSLPGLACSWLVMASPTRGRCGRDSLAIGREDRLLGVVGSTELRLACAKAWRLWAAATG